MLYVDDKLPRHPKIFKAGALIGDHGAAQALALYMDGLSYAREHLTDGFLPAAFVRRSALVSKPELVANALSSRSVQLWHKTKGGYRIHDYHHWNRKAADIKKKRADERDKKAKQREEKAAREKAMSLDVSQGDKSRTSCARASTIHDPRTPRTSTDPVLPGSLLQPARSVQENKPTLARRQSPSNVNGNGGEEQTHAPTDGPTPDSTQATLRDCQSGNRATASDRQLRVAGGDQGATGSSGVGLSAGLGSDSSGDASGREGSHASEDLQADRQQARGPATITGAAAAAIEIPAQLSRRSVLEFASGYREETSGIELLQRRVGEIVSRSRAQ